MVLDLVVSVIINTLEPPVVDRVVLNYLIVELFILLAMKENVCVSGHALESVQMARELRFMGIGSPTFRTRMNSTTSRLDPPRFWILKS